MYCFSSIGCVPQRLLTLKILDKPHLRSKGFMGWTQPPNDHYGMLFHHDHEHPQSYWMDTVPFDLDCLGFDKDNRLVEIIYLTALERASRGFSRPVKNVVEVRGGWCQEHGIKSGDKLIFIEKL